MNLQLGDGFLLDAEDDDVLATDSNGGRPLLDGLLSVLNLKQSFDDSSNSSSFIIARIAKKDLRIKNTYLIVFERVDELPNTWVPRFRFKTRLGSFIGPHRGFIVIFKQT